MALAKASKQRRPQVPSPSGGGQGGGLRERKKQKTRESIQRTALRLFVKQGYEETTIEQIAAAAEISPSTFFNYFPTKEDVVLFDAYDPVAIRMFLERPKDEPLNVVVRRVLEGLAQVFQRDEDVILARGRLFLEVPELRARMWEETERTLVIINQILAERTGRRPDDFELRVTARLITAALMEATLEWMRSNGRRDLVELSNRALDVVDSGAQLSRLTSARPRKRRPSS